MPGKHKWKIYVAAVLSASILLVLVFAMARKDELNSVAVIDSDGSRESKEIQGISRPLAESACQEIFGQMDWPVPKSVNDILSCHKYQFGDFDFLKLGDSVRGAIGYGWFDEGRSFWWADRSGQIQTAKLSGLELMRKISFAGFKVHQIQPDVELEKDEPWRKTNRQLAELDFRGAVGLPGRVIALFGHPGYLKTNLIELALPSLEVVSAKQVSGIFTDIIDLGDDRTIVIKGDDRIGFCEFDNDEILLCNLGTHRSVKKDGEGVFINFRDDDSYSLGYSKDTVVTKHRSDHSAWRLNAKRTGDEAQQDGIETLIQADGSRKFVMVKKGDNLAGYALGYNLPSPEFHPGRNLGLVSVRGLSSRMPGFGMLVLDELSGLIPKTSARNRAGKGKGWVSQNVQSVPELSSTTQLEASGKFLIDQIQSGEGAIAFPSIDDQVIFDEDFAYYETEQDGQANVVCLNIRNWDVEFVLSDLKLGTVTENFLVVEQKGRFVAIDKHSQEYVCDLPLSPSAQFADGHFGDLVIADRFDTFNSPAVIDVSLGELLTYLPRLGASSSEQQREREEPLWFNRQTQSRRWLAGMTVIWASGRKSVEIAPNGKWAFSRFGLLDLDWPKVRHTPFPEMPQVKNNKDPYIVPQHFSRDSRFAFFPASNQPSADGSYLGLVRPLNDSEHVERQSDDEAQKDLVHLRTRHQQIWMDQNPVTGHYWVRTRERANEESNFQFVFRMEEFDRSGNSIREILDFSDEAQHRRFMGSGDLVCWGDGPITRVKIVEVDSDIPGD